MDNVSKVEAMAPEGNWTPDFEPLFAVPDI
jgi:hypothetical protein